VLDTLLSSGLIGDCQYPFPCLNEISAVQVMTYGTENDNEDWVQAQRDMGTSGVIVDNVANIVEYIARYDAC
jgi:glycerophosphoryl diester phosphodiesterase